MLANCDAISGIYTAFFPVIIYIFMGTSRHVSMGKNILFSLFYIFCFGVLPLLIYISVIGSFAGDATLRRRNICLTVRRDVSPTYT